ncbi:Malate Na(+) symporter [[Actinomadura] parvosata subsp. kistnae]|uniref:Na+/H+ antiporter NhaC n=1 Tax=[Actinomadura] parvosata subsp. kistnae TaxID=1909395 RepID=A0A1V0AGX5_9ACTN|nr:Na+/H+ antiporter NhaC [Nonomuraea sp. ATCC 55076]AQZ69456.1 Na+/H+ antiporter NhaC [Nonomuraea sp. ATCC 55076]SPL91894.1 Malate Na(+) symporter [Actinomadura parvosata subsp. kistnae]
MSDSTEGDAQGDTGRSVRPPSLADLVIVLGALVVLIGGSLALFGLDALNGPLQVALVLCALVAMLVVLRNGNRWEEVEASGQRALSSITSAVFILLAVGALIGTWNMSGTIPTLVYYGIQVLSPGWYYAAAALLCGIVAMSIGSSWTTAATIGVGLVGIATMLGVSAPITAGAVISGAYLGDKLSPLSETTVLTAQMVRVNVYEHIKRQAWTSIPAFLIAFVLFLLIGWVWGPAATDLGDTGSELNALGDIYWITPLNLLPLLLLVVLSARKVPATLALMAAAIFAGIVGSFTQPAVIRAFVGEPGLNPVVAGIKAVWRAMANGYEKSSGLADVDRLLSRGGMDSMLPTLWLIIGAVTFGTLLEEFGLLNRLIELMVRAAKSTGRLSVAVFASAFGLNIVAGDQYIALVLPARVFRVEFAKRGLAPTNLSRLTADSGTVTSPLVPWNSCGAFMGAVLGVPTLAYLPFCFFNIASPLLSVVYGFTGFKIEHVPPESRHEDAEPRGG